MIIDIVNGFLGCGKTTFIEQMIKQLTPLEKVVILVNEFGRVGIDGTLLKQGGSEVVELSSGCICCTLRADLGRQIPEIVSKYAPDRLIIEPSGVATVKNLLETVGGLRFEPYVQGIRAICIVDAQAFNDLYGASPLFVRSQLVHSDIVLINKCDLVTGAEIAKIRETISQLNNRATILLTEFCRIGLEQLDAPPASAGADHDGGADILRRHDYIPDTPPYQSFSRQVPGTFSREALRGFFSEMVHSGSGEIIRAKGFFKLKDGWARFDFLPGQAHESDLPGDFDESRIIVIGHKLDTIKLAQKLYRCLIQSGGVS